ncbi:MAG: 4-hydroxyphenylacetate 3-hydroxylase N-terminal domain-containing protein, partial [Actinomycetota bacterium]|nr:4-hydroxyphenylacetate 3-hydroxylase N-terminal domain-containing protein [Actinomycetota bacterium]
MLTGQQYCESLDDGREVYYQGERVSVTEHPIFERELQRAD